MNKQPIIQLEEVYFQYEAHRKVLSGVNLTVEAGDFLGLVGPNGSGKSTLIKIILGLVTPQKGRVSLFGQPLNRFTEWSKIGYVSQRANRFNSGFPATVYEVIVSGLYGKLGLFKRPGKREKEKIEATIESVGLTALARERIGRLSGGQQQRVLIARALVSEPKLLILDEPLVGVDVDSVNRFYELMGRLNREQDITLLLVSHDIGVITSQVKQVACLNKQLFFHGDPATFAEQQESILAQAYGHDIHVLKHSH